MNAMRYFDGKEVRLGDVVKFNGNDVGTVVCSIDTKEFSEEYTEADWSYLQKGVMIDSPKCGLVHYKESEGLSLVARKLST
jgi:hypothetical protein